MATNLWLTFSEVSEDDKPTNPGEESPLKESLSHLYKYHTMSSIFSMIVFLRELIFGRMKSTKRTRMQVIKSCAVIGLMCVSVYLNYTFIRLWFGSTARFIAVQRTLEDQQKMKDEISDLQQKVKTYEDLMDRWGVFIPPLSPEIKPSPPLPTSPPQKPGPTEHNVGQVTASPPQRPIPEPAKQTEIE